MVPSFVPTVVPPFVSVIVSTRGIMMAPGVAMTAIPVAVSIEP